MKKRLLFLTPLLTVPLLLSQNNNNEKHGNFFKTQPLEVLDGAKNSELIPEVNRWDEFRRMVIHAARADQANGNINNGNIKMERPAYVDKLHALLGVDFDEVADLALQADQRLNKFREQQREQLRDFLSRPEVEQLQLAIQMNQTSNAIIDGFTRDVLSVLQDDQKAQVLEYVRRECVKRVKFVKLPPRAPK